jgi:ABC-type transport system substrate-binding protein
VRYEYDPRKATQVLEALGYARAADGVFRDRANEKLAFQIRTSQGDVLQEKAMYASADDWQRLGVDIERHLVVPQRATDAEYRATFPAFDLKRQAGAMSYATSFHSSRVALPENNYLVSGNNARYRHPELDSLIDRYFTTIPLDERMDLAARIVHHVSDQVAWMGLFYQTDPDLVSNRLHNRLLAQASNSSLLWNAHLWEMK